MEISEICLQLKDDHERKKMKNKGFIFATLANDSVPNKENIEQLCCVDIEEEVEKCADLMLEKFHHLNGNEWVVTEEDNIKLILTSVNGTRHQVTIEGDANVIRFNMLCLNRRLLKLG